MEMVFRFQQIVRMLFMQSLNILCKSAQSYYMLAVTNSFIPAYASCSGRHEKR